MNTLQTQSREGTPAQELKVSTDSHMTVICNGSVGLHVRSSDLEQAKWTVIGEVPQLSALHVLPKDIGFFTYDPKLHQSPSDPRTEVHASAWRTYPVTQAVEVLLKKPEDGSSGMIEAEQQSPNVIEEDEASADECYVLHLDNWRKDGQHPYIEHSLKGSREGSFPLANPYTRLEVDDTFVEGPPSPPLSDRPAPLFSIGLEHAAMQRIPSIDQHSQSTSSSDFVRPMHRKEQPWMLLDGIEYDSSASFPLSPHGPYSSAASSLPLESMTSTKEKTDSSLRSESLHFHSIGKRLNFMATSSCADLRKKAQQQAQLQDLRGEEVDPASRPGPRRKSHLSQLRHSALAELADGTSVSLPTTPNPELRHPVPLRKSASTEFLRRHNVDSPVTAISHKDMARPEMGVAQTFGEMMDWQISSAIDAEPATLPDPGLPYATATSDDAVFDLGRGMQRGAHEGTVPADENTDAPQKKIRRLQSVPANMHRYRLKRTFPLPTPSPSPPPFPHHHDQEIICANTAITAESFLRDPFPPLPTFDTDVDTNDAMPASAFSNFPEGRPNSPHPDLLLTCEDGPPRLRRSSSQDSFMAASTAPVLNGSKKVKLMRFD